jgi:hypothetical protein
MQQIDPARPPPVTAATEQQQRRRSSLQVNLADGVN